MITVNQIIFELNQTCLEFVKNNALCIWNTPSTEFCFIIQVQKVSQNKFGEIEGLGISSGKKFLIFPKLFGTKPNDKWNFCNTCCDSDFWTIGLFGVFLTKILSMQAGLFDTSYVTNLYCKRIWMSQAYLQLHL